MKVVNGYRVKGEPEPEHQSEPEKDEPARTKRRTTSRNKARNPDEAPTGDDDTARDS